MFRLLWAFKINSIHVHWDSNLMADLGSGNRIDMNFMFAD